MAKLTTPGRYQAKVTAVEFGESRTGTPYINLYFNTEAGSIGSWLYLSEKALPYTTKSLRDAFDFNNDYESAGEQIQGKDCSITVEEDEDDDGNAKLDDKGNPKLVVKFVNKPSNAKPIGDKVNFLKNLSAQAKMIPKDLPKSDSKVKNAPPVGSSAKKPF